MSTLKQQLTAGNETGEECTFEQRQSTPWYTLLFTLLGIMDFAAATSLLIVMITFNSWSVYRVFSDVLCFLTAAYILYSAFTLRWCEIKDLGTKLSVRLSPSTALYGRMGSAQIAYDDIVSYEDPSGCCENCCGLCVAVNPCGCFGIKPERSETSMTIILYIKKRI